MERKVGNYKTMLLGLGHPERNKRARQLAGVRSRELARYEMKRDTLEPAVAHHATNIALGCLESLTVVPIVKREYGH